MAFCRLCRSLFVCLLAFKKKSKKNMLGIMIGSTEFWGGCVAGALIAIVVAEFRMGRLCTAHKPYKKLAERVERAYFALSAFSRADIDVINQLKTYSSPHVTVTSSEDIEEAPPDEQSRMAIVVARFDDVEEAYFDLWQFSEDERRTVKSLKKRAV